MKMSKDVAGNFIRQSKRIEKKTKVAGGKNDKRSVFAEVAATLLGIGGGDAANLTCAKQYGTEGAQQLQNLTSTLLACEATITEACNTSMPEVDLAFIDQCALTVEAFNAETDKCQQLRGGGCDCWESAELATLMGEVRLCKISDSSKAVNDAFAMCKEEFGKCRKYEDAAIETISTCSQDPGALKLKAAALSTNKAALAKARTKVSSLTSRRMVFGRTISSCADMVTQVSALVIITDPTDSSISTIAVSISSASVTCTDDEVSSLKTLETDLETMEAAIDSALTAVQAALAAATGSTVPTSSATSRARLRRNLNNIKTWQ